jgi:hypothetical protein
LAGINDSQEENAAFANDFDEMKSENGLSSIRVRTILAQGF